MGIYFIFMRFCMLLNIGLAVLWVACIVLPYAVIYGFQEDVYVPAAETGYGAGEKFVGLFNGGGSFNTSAMFIGAYMLPNVVPSDLRGSAGTVPNPFSPPVDGGDGREDYDFALAYVLMGTLLILGSYLVISYGLWKSIIASGYRTDRVEHRICGLMFATMDYSVTDGSSIALLQKQTCRHIQEVLDENKMRDQWLKQWKQNYKRFVAKRVATNLVVIGALVGSAIAIFESVDKYQLGTQLERLIPAVVIAVLNMVVPFGFEMLAEQEEYSTPLAVIRVTIVRSILLRIGSITVFFWASFTRSYDYGCWENFIGREAYTLFMVGFVFEIVTALTSDMCYTLSYKKMECVRSLVDTPAYFDTVKRVMELIYAQTIVWFGMFWCPLLPVFGVLRCAVLFYLQKWSTNTWCEPRGKAFESKYSLPRLVWGLLLCFNFGAAVPLGYAISSLPTSGVYNPDQLRRMVPLDTDGTPAAASSSPCGAEPSASCVSDCFGTSTSTSGANTICFGDEVFTLEQFCRGCPTGCSPFRDQTSIYTTLELEYADWEQDAREVFTFMGTTAFAFMILVVLFTFMCYLNAKSNARKARITKLCIERDMERMDKIWILDKYKIKFDEDEVFDTYKGGGSKAPARATAPMETEMVQRRVNAKTSDGADRQPDRSGSVSRRSGSVSSLKTRSLLQEHAL